MRHSMNLMPVPFEMIKSGQKTIELRLNDEKRQLICINDEIEFINVDDISQLQSIMVWLSLNTI